MRGPGNKKPRPKELASKELASKELGVLGYSDLLGMQWRSRLFRSIGIGRSRLFRSIGIGRSRLFRSIGSGRSDEWKSRCNVPPGGGTLHLHIFVSNGSVIDDWASMIGKVGAMCRPPAAHCTSLFFPMDWASMIGRNVSLVSFSFLFFLLGGTGRPFKL